MAFSSPTMRRPIVVLPHPDSPTSPNVSPSRRVKETSETAWTLPDLVLDDGAGGEGELLHEVLDLEDRLAVGQLADPRLGALEGLTAFGSSDRVSTRRRSLPSPPTGWKQAKT